MSTSSEFENELSRNKAQFDENKMQFARKHSI